MTDDNCFTKVFLKKFPLIEEKTIKTLITNGFKNKEILLFLNLDTDLPAIPDISMAQKLVLKQILSEFQEIQKNLMQSIKKKITEEVADTKSDADENQDKNVGQRVAESPEQSPVPESLAPKNRKTVVSVDQSSNPELSAISSDRNLFNPSTSRQTVSSFPEKPMSLKSGVSTSMTNPHSDLYIESNVDIKVEYIEEEVQIIDPIPVVELSSDESDDENQTEEVAKNVEQLSLPKGLTPKHCKPVIIIDRLSTSHGLSAISSASDGYLFNPSTSRQTMKPESDVDTESEEQTEPKKTAIRPKSKAKKQYRCEYCNGKFSNGSDLQRHKLIHMGEKSYRCWICGKRFRQKSTLNYHKRNDHKN